jgi:hypothetical protein
MVLRFRFNLCHQLSLIRLSYTIYSFLLLSNHISEMRRAIDDTRSVADSASQMRSSISRCLSLALTPSAVRV